MPEFKLPTVVSFRRFMRLAKGIFRLVLLGLEIFKRISDLL